MAPTDAASRIAVLFDFGGTLDADGVPWRERFLRLFRDEGVRCGADAFDPAFHGADDALVGTVPPDLSWRVTVAMLAGGVARNLGLRDGPLGEKITGRFLSEAGERLKASAALLAPLSRRYRLGIVSNFYGNLAAVCREVGLAPYLSVVVDSAQVGCAKPDPRIFRIALEAVGARPAQAVFVGDSMRRDMAGARQIGMPHIWLRGQGSSEEGPCCPGDPVVGRLEEVRGMLL
ncbi:MAG TPA: HAD family hydrolase [Candidatus Methylomirabilis sp.]|jgi:putative hydrolase of the HAD superfamily